MGNSRKKNGRRNSAIHPGSSENHSGEEKKTVCNCPYCNEKNTFSDENEKTAVYESLRNEIISTQGMRTNLIVYMFSVYFLLFGYGVGNEARHKLCFVATYAVLIAFQTKIIRAKYTIARISVFIREYYEPKTEEKIFKWETINLENDFFRTNNKVITFFSSTAALQLGVLSLVAFVLSTCKSNCISIQVICSLGIKVIYFLPCSDILLFFICFICLIILIIIRDEYKVSKKIIKKMEEQFKKIQINNMEKSNR